MNLPKELMEIIVAQVSKEFENQSRQKRENDKDWRLRNTRYLLRNYRKLKSHCEVTSGEIKDHEDVLQTIYLSSVTEYKVKTIKMMEYVDMMLESYKKYCESRGEAVRRRYAVINSLYLDTSVKDMTQDRIGEIHAVDVRTVRRDEKKAIDEISIYLFGISHLSDLIEEEMSER